MLLLQLLVWVGVTIMPNALWWLYSTHIFLCCLYLIRFRTMKGLILLFVGVLMAWMGNGMSPISADNVRFTKGEHYYFRLLLPVEGRDLLPVLLLSDALFHPPKGLGQDGSLVSWRVNWFDKDKVQTLRTVKVFTQQDYLQNMDSQSINPVHYVEYDFDGVLQKVSYANQSGNYLERYLFKNRLLAEFYFNQATIQSAIVTRTAQQQISTQARAPSQTTGLPQTSPLAYSSANWGERLKRQFDVSYAHMGSWRYSRGLVFGKNQLLSQSERWQIQTLGLSHLFVVSGLHVGFVYLLARLLALALWSILPAIVYRYGMHKRLLVAGCCLPVVCLYGELVGWGPAVTRASLMLFVWLACQLLQVKISTLQVLFGALYIMLIIEPRTVYSAGFWLSFTLVFLLLECYRQRQTKPWLLAQLLLTLASIMLIIGWQQELSAFSVVINLVLIPLTATIWFPMAVLSLVETYFIESTVVMGLLDWLIQSLVNVLRYMAFELPLLTLNSYLALGMKLLGIGLIWLWLKNLFSRYSWCCALVALLFVLVPGKGDSDIAHWCFFSACASQTYVIKNQFGHLNLLQRGLDGSRGDINAAEPNASNEWQLVSMKWLTDLTELEQYSITFVEPIFSQSTLSKATFLQPDPSQATFAWPNDALKLVVWPQTVAAISSAKILAISPDWLILPALPSANVTALLAGLKVHWLYIEPNEKVIFRKINNAWHVTYSNCLFSWISTREAGCERVELLESMIN